MSEFFVESEVIRVSFPDENWVDIKQELTQEDQDYIVSKLAQPEKDSKISFSFGRLSLLERSIIAWSFNQPVNRDNISKLRQKYRNLILQEIDKRDAEATQFSKN